MCVIVVNATGKVPPRETLEACEAGNPDGIGIAWQTSRKIVYHRGIAMDALVNWTQHVEKNKFPYIIHFRFATIGDPTKPAWLCHPFPISDQLADLKKLDGTTRHAVFAHNGSWSEWPSKFYNGTVGYLKQEGWSDSAILAWLLGKGREVDLSTAGYGHRVATLSMAGGLQTFGEDWMVEDDISYSNRSWKWKIRSFPAASNYGFYNSIRSNDFWAAGRSWENYTDYISHFLDEDQCSLAANGVDKNYFSRQEEDQVLAYSRRQCKHKVSFLDYCSKCEADHPTLTQHRQEAQAARVNEHLARIAASRLPAIRDHVKVYRSAVCYFCNGSGKMNELGDSCGVCEGKGSRLVAD